MAPFLKSHYTAAATSAMSYTSMFTGKYCHEIRERSDYSDVEDFNGDTLFKKLSSEGYECHIVWAKSWMKSIIPKTRIYSNDTIFHDLEIEQQISNKKVDPGKISMENEKKSMSILQHEIEKIHASCGEKLFIWIHLPHVISGRNCYGSDIDLFDEFVGFMRSKFNDDDIFITSDHGHMNIEKGIPVYGFHVYEGGIKIPLITPRINSLKEVNFATSHVNLNELLLYRKITKNEYTFCDTQYYKQYNRRLAIIYKEFKYIYNKRTRTEELYDLEFDPNENVNLLCETILEQGRNRLYYLNEVYYYPKWNLVKEVYQNLKKKKEEIWREETRMENISIRIYHYLQHLKSILFGKMAINSKWGSNPQITLYNK